MSEQRHHKLISTGITGLDRILQGGIPERSINIITGGPGAGKTILSQQILYHNATDGRKVLYMTTLSEPSMKVLHYLQDFEFFNPELITKQVTYLDIGGVIREEGLENSIEVIVEHVQEHEPSIVVIDSFKAIHDMAKSTVKVREFGYDLAVNLTTWNTMALLVGEYGIQHIEKEPIFAIADGIISLLYKPIDLHYRRYIDILKMRGSAIVKGLHPFQITNHGITVYPRLTTPKSFDAYSYSTARISSGLETLDEMLGGGFLEGTATMIAGGAGTGKTLLALHYVMEGLQKDEPGVIVTFQENPSQLRSIAKSFGWSMSKFHDEKLLTHFFESPVEIRPDVLADKIIDVCEETGAKRVVIDSINDIEAATEDKLRYKDYIYSLVHYFKSNKITSVLTTEIPELYGPVKMSEQGVSFIADNLVLLRYIEYAGAIGRAINVLKSRGSFHSKIIRKFEISKEGVEIGDPIIALTGFMTGNPVYPQNRPVTVLSPEMQYVFSLIGRKESISFDTLRDDTGFQEDRLVNILSQLARTKHIVEQQVESEKCYRISI